MERNVSESFTNLYSSVLIHALMFCLFTKKKFLFSLKHSGLQERSFPLDTKIHALALVLHRYIVDKAKPIVRWGRKAYGS